MRVRWLPGQGPSLWPGSEGCSRHSVGRRRHGDHLHHFIIFCIIFIYIYIYLYIFFYIHRHPSRGRGHIVPYPLSRLSVAAAVFSLSNTHDVPMIPQHKACVRRSSRRRSVRNPDRPSSFVVDLHGG